MLLSFPIARAELFLAKDEEEAEEKARLLGLNSEHEYESVSRDMVKWKFRHILSIQEILSGDISDGIEVFSRFLKTSAVSSLRTPFDDKLIFHFLHYTDDLNEGK